MTAPSAPSADAFVRDAESELLELAKSMQQADWVYNTYITPDTEAMSARATAAFIQATVVAAKRGRAYAGELLSEPTRRKLALLPLSLPMIAPSDPKGAEELTTLVAAMTGTYGRGKYAPKGTATPLDVQGLGRILAEQKDPALLLDVWRGWHDIGRTMRRPFERYVALANAGAKELDFADTGAMWRSKYDMPAEAFRLEVERLWEQVRPLYQSLHAYVRWRLVDELGPAVVPPTGPVPAHLLGNMWAQSWEYLVDRLLPARGGGAPDVTRALRAHRVDQAEMVRYGERFFVSLGLPALPATFWERSMFTKPADREVICHASAWDLDLVDDLRIKMCIEITGEDFQTIHHELGHNYYQRAYAGQPFLFRDGAHDGFHEAIGDAIALSVTPEYLRTVGLVDQVPGPEADLRLLLGMALEKIAFLPFGLAIDQWRWRVFSGEIDPSTYNASWWETRRKLQGIAPGLVRDESEFDPGAKFHVPANVPYMRYFLAHILQFQFHRAFVRAAGGSGPLHRSSIYGSRPAGDRLRAMLEMGQSRPWPDALEAATGERRMDASALLEYFDPLRRWLDEQNRGHPVGW
ncbi:MAG TPA: M2 family metallopeptidase [Thermoplasmata archaeon]|nr:M2 family metallopeptidase [Thermoplasmata archaeon]